MTTKAFPTVPKQGGKFLHTFCMFYPVKFIWMTTNELVLQYFASFLMALRAHCSFSPKSWNEHF